MKKPALPKLAAIVALLMTIGGVFGAWRDSLLLLPLALIPATACVGILRGRAWSAYGLALLQAAQLLLIPLTALRGRPIAPEIYAACAFTVALIALFWFSGRKLEAAGAQRGSPIGWVLLSACITLPFLFLEPFVLPTASMENTILQGEKVVVVRFPAATPQRNEIVAFRYPIDRRQTFCKRIVGVEGDRIKIVAKNLYRNGIRVNDPEAIHRTGALDDFRDNFPSTAAAPLYQPAVEMLEKNVQNGEIVVPKGKFFVLGDNRDLSLDSRYWGFIEQKDIVGRAWFIYGSPDKSRILKTL